VLDALPRPTLAALTDQWSLQPLALAAAVLLAGWYVRGAHRQAGWPARRTVAFLAGTVALAWTTGAFPGAYAPSLYWVWTAQTLGLLLIVPLLLVAGRPLELMPPPVAGRILRSPPMQALSSPLVGPGLLLVLSAALFFGPIPGWAIDVPALGWLLQLVLVGIGAVIALPLVGGDGPGGSLAVGLAAMVGLVELILDAIPGVVLRLQTHTVTAFFDHRTSHSWSPRPVHDQQLAGAILWCVAEIIDLPFLVLAFRRWVRADNAEAARIDTVLDAERTARNAQPDADAALAERDAPWWLTDPTMRDRFRQ